jgi:hypothetical protein
MAPAAGIFLPLLAAAARPQPNVRLRANGTFVPVTAADLRRRRGRRLNQHGLLFDPSQPGCDFSTWPHVWEPKRLGGHADSHEAQVCNRRIIVLCEHAQRRPFPFAQVQSSRPGGPTTPLRVIYPGALERQQRRSAVGSCKKAAVQLIECNRGVRTGELGKMVCRRHARHPPC